MSNDLKYDAERDLQDIGASKIEVHRLNKVRIVTHTHTAIDSLNTIRKS